MGHRSLEINHCRPDLPCESPTMSVVGADPGVFSGALLMPAIMELQGLLSGVARLRNWRTLQGKGPAEGHSFGSAATSCHHVEMRG